MRRAACFGKSIVVSGAEQLLGPPIVAAMGGYPEPFEALCARAWANGVIRLDPAAIGEIVVCRDLHGEWRILTRRPMFRRPRDVLSRVAHLAWAFGEIAVKLGLASDALAVSRALTSGAASSTRLVAAVAARASVRVRVRCRVSARLRLRVRRRPARS